MKPDGPNRKTDTPTVGALNSGNAGAGSVRRWVRHYGRTESNNMADEQYWQQNYNTPLSAENERRFNNWVAQQSKKRGRDLSGDLTNYDLRGYWVNGGYNDSGDGHMPDTYKKPNHDSFSNESKYHGTADPWGGKFEGGRWVGDDKTGWSYQASARMLKTTHDRNQLQQYFADNEPGVMLLMPTVNQR